jgi:leader peptidase (prepilin peptidase) / N-methyltransferase
VRACCVGNGLLVMAPSLTPVLCVLAGVLGLAVGSFLNVVIHRVPARVSVVAPASACPACGHAIRNRDNVPVVSWLVLRGRCRDCSAPISARYPAVELATGVLFALVSWLVSLPGLPAISAAPFGSVMLVLIALLYVMAISVALAAIDLETHTLPNRIVLPAYVVVIVLLGVAALAAGDWAAMGRAAIGLILLGAAYLVLAIAVPGGMGLGDVKLAGVLGFVLAYLGWGPLVVGAFGAFVLGGTFAFALVATRRAQRGSGIPFGPWMLAGAWIGVATGGPLWDAYLRLLGLA